MKGHFKFFSSVSSNINFHFIKLINYLKSHNKVFDFYTGANFSIEFFREF